MDGSIHGKGFYTYSDGGNYLGDFVEGVKQGKGKYTSANGKV